jgi:autotransporter-associated beta strand protein
VGGGGLTKGGAGNLTLKGTNVYTGATRVNAGSLTLDPATSNSLGEIQVAGSSSLNIGSAAVRQTTGNFVIYAGSANLTAGAVSNGAGYAYIGYNSGAGTLAVNDGFFFTPNELNVGAWAGSTGYLNLSNGTVAARLLYVGRGGNGTVTQTGGAVKLTGSAGGDGWRIGGWSDTTAKGTGVYNLLGGELNSGANNLQIGCSGSGTLRQTGGSVTCGGWPVVGRFGGGVGLYSLEGGVFNQTATGSKLIAAEAGTGTFTVKGSGVANLMGGLLISTAAGSTGTVNLASGGTINTPSVAKSSGPSATFNFDGGVLRARASGSVLASFMQGLNAANVKAGGAVVDSSNNTVTVAQSLRSGALPDGGLTKRGTGVLVLAGTNSYNGVTRVEEGTLRLGCAAAVTNGGAVTVAGGCYDLGGYTVTNGAVSLESGTIVNGTLKAAALTAAVGTVQADLAGAGSLTKSGSGEVVLCGTNTYTGATRVDGGTLRVGTLPLHRWSFNGDAKDSVGHADATAMGAVTSDGRQYTLAGDGTRGSSYINLGPNILPSDGVTPITVELWATENVVKPWSRIFDFGSSIDNNMMMVWYASYTDIPSWVEVKVGGTVVARTIEVPATYSAGAEYHIAFELIPGAGAGGTVLVKWYVLNSAGTTLKAGSMDANFSLASFVQQNMWLGHSEYTSDPDGNASYNEVRIWPRALSQAQLAQNSILGPDVLPTLADNTLPAQSPVSVAAGAALDLGGSSQTVDSLSGCGAVSNGALAVTGVIAPGGTNVIGALTLDASVSLTGTLLVDAAWDGACDRLQVSGGLDLRGLSLQVQDQSQLKARTQYVIATCAPGGLAGPFESTNLDRSRWAVSYNNGSGEVRLVSRGLMLILR